MPTTHNYIGGAAYAQQVDTYTLANTWAAADTLTTTLTDENGESASVITTADDGVIENIRDKHLAALQGSSDARFTAVTWAASSTNAITGTAIVIGVPMHGAASETTAGDGTFTRAVTTANSGPEDFDVAANFSTASKPADGDTVLVVPNPTDGVSYNIKYSLPKAVRDEASLTLVDFRVSKAYRGVIGQPAYGYYLELESVTGVVELAGATSTWLEGSMPVAYILAGTGSEDLVHLKSTAAMKVYVRGANVAGTISVADNSVMDELYMFNCPRAVVNIGKDVTSLDVINVMSGLCTSKSGGSSLVVDVGVQGSFTLHPEADEDVSKVTTWQGGHSRWNGSGTLSTNHIKGGTMDLRENQATQMTITDTEIWDGLLTDEGGLGNIVYTNNIIRHGGTVLSEAGVTVDYI